MSRLMLVVAGALMLGVGVQVPQDVDGRRSTVNGQQSTVERRLLTVVPAPWLQADPADSIYRVAREALNKGRFREALEAFQQLERKYPESGYVADGLYWQAFALYRLGGRANLQRASAKLEEQQSRFPQAATRGDAETLSVRITSELARLGDMNASADLVRMTAPVVAPTAPTAPAAPRPPRAPRAPRPGMAIAQDDCGEDADVKVMALQGLMRNNSERAIPIIEKVMAKRDTASACLRRQALFVLASSNDPAANRLLLQAVGDPDQEVREQAVFWLARTDDPRAVTVLDSVLQATKDEDVQQAALFALSTKHSPEARRLLRTYVTKPGLSPELTQAALFQVARDPETTPAELKQFYANAKTTEMKQQVLVAMMGRRDKDTQWLMQIATNKNEDSELREQALMTLVQSDLPTADMLKLFDSLPADDEMQGMMIMLMAKRPNDPAITDRLINIAKTSKDKELRQQAIFWLSQSKDPRATKLLEEMLAE
jgi:HEAT repeat protein